MQVEKNAGFLFDVFNFNCYIGNVSEIFLNYKMHQQH